MGNAGFLLSTVVELFRASTGVLALFVHRVPTPFVRSYGWV